MPLTCRPLRRALLLLALLAPLAQAETTRTLSLGLALEQGAGGWHVPPVVPAIPPVDDAPWVALRVPWQGAGAPARRPGAWR